jgi:glycosyltransferase involved in cell wall biosynthesis
LNPTVSIITVAYNSEKTIKDTIESVLCQSYQNIEYIIVDGKSNDKTIEIASSYKNKFKGRLRIISEEDNGLYDAMNKGITAAKGDIIGIINSDDFYIDNKVIEKVVSRMVRENVDSLYANLVFISDIDKNKIVRTWIAKTGSFRMGWNPPHPTVFIKKSVYEKYGLFNTSFRIAADYDILYRFFEKYKITTTYLNEYIVKMRIGGESTKGIKSNIKGNMEIYSILKKYNQRFCFLVLQIRLLRKILQVKIRK